MDDSFDLVERDKGILTKRDRRFLLGELDEELSDNAKNVRRYEIRNRTRERNSRLSAASETLRI